MTLTGTFKLLDAFRQMTLQAVSVVQDQQASVLQIVIMATMLIQLMQGALSAIETVALAGVVTTMNAFRA